MCKKAYISIKGNQEIYVASLLLLAARIGTKHANLVYVKLALQFRLMLPDKLRDLFKARDLYLPLRSHEFIIPSFIIADDIMPASTVSVKISSTRQTVGAGF